MSKLNLINWNDKLAIGVKERVDSIEKNVIAKDLLFKADAQQVQADNTIEIPYSFEPGDYKI